MRVGVESCNNDGYEGWQKHLRPTSHVTIIEGDMKGLCRSFDRDAQSSRSRVRDFGQPSATKQAKPCTCQMGEEVRGT